MKTGENSHFEFLGQKVKILAYKCLIKLRRSWKLEEVHLIWKVMRVALGPTVVLTPEPTLWDVWFRRYEHFRKNFFLVKKSKFWLRSPPEAPETPEMDWNRPHWRPLNDLRWVWDILFWSQTFFCIYILYSGDIGQLAFFFTGGGTLASKRFEIGGVSFRVISSPMNSARGNGFIGSWDQNWPVQTKSSDILAFSGLWGLFRRP